MPSSPAEGVPDVKKRLNPAVNADNVEDAFVAYPYTVPVPKILIKKPSDQSAYHPSAMNSRQSMGGPAAGRQTLNTAAGRHSLIPLPGRIKQVREAKQMEEAVNERAQRMGVPPPNYDFLELIGKGTFGRVFKSKRQSDKSLVALKIIEVDSSDYQLDPAEKDQAIQDFVNEISILHTLKDSKAKNINIIHEAFTFYSQLWIVSDLCPGGSVHTLMKACKTPGLEEKYIKVIARELAVALKHIHGVGIIHRDVKAANVLITQDGQLQLCDFGVSGVLESNVSKRSTFVGTPFWMAPELLENAPGLPVAQGYGTEVDCWAYGCTLYELATGRPPNAHVDARRLRFIIHEAIRLEGEDYSQDLKDFVSYCLEDKPSMRPTAEKFLQHEFIAGTDTSHPTNMLRELIERYTRWEQQGGERISLFGDYGAQAPGSLDPINDEEEDWNFSTSDDVDLDMLEQHPDLLEESVGTPDRGSESLSRSQSTRNMTPMEKIMEEQRMKRAEMQMGRLFNPNLEDEEGYRKSFYDKGVAFPPEESDLPFRNGGMGPTDVRESVIDLDAAMDMPGSANIDLGNVATIKLKRSQVDFAFGSEPEEEPSYPEYEPHPDAEKRSTMAWKFPSMTMPAAAENRRTLDWTFDTAGYNPDDAPQSADETLLSSSHENKQSAPFRPPLRHMATEPVGQFGDHFHKSNESAEIDLDDANRNSIIDLDSADVYGTQDAYEPAYSHPGEFSYNHSRVPTAYSSAANSTISERTTGDPFDLADSSYVEENRESSSELTQRASQHVHSHSEPKPDRTSDNQFADDFDYMTGKPLRGRGSSFSNDKDSSLARAPSVKASMDTLRNHSDDEEDSSPEAAPRRGSHVNGSWDINDTESRFTAVSSHPRDTMTMKRMTPHPNAFANSVPNGATDHTVRPSARGGKQTFAPPRMEDMEYVPPPHQTMQQHQQVHRPVQKEFPTPIPAAPEAFEDDAEPALVAEELDKLMTQLRAGFRLVGELL